MNIDILAKVIHNKDITNISFIEFIKLTMENVENMETIKGAEKQLIVVSVIEDFIKDNDSLLANELRSVVNNGTINYIIDTIVYSTKNNININITPKNFFVFVFKYILKKMISQCKYIITHQWCIKLQNRRLSSYSKIVKWLSLLLLKCLQKT